MKKWRNKILSPVLTLSLLLTSTSIAFAVGDDGTADYTQVKIDNTRLIEKIPSTVHSNSSIDNAFDTNADGTVNNNTIWHTSYNVNGGASTDSELYLIVKFDKPVNLNKITFLPRQDKNENGRITEYEITAGNTLDEDNNIIDDKVISGATGTWTNDASEKTAEIQVCDLVQYVKLKAVASNGNFICAANIAYYENILQPIITEQPQGNFASTANLSVTAKPSDGVDNLTYQWYTYSNSDSESTVTAISGATESSYTATGNNGNIGYFVRVTQTVDGRVGYVDSQVVYVIAPTTEEYNIDDNTGLVKVIDCSSEYTNNPKENAIDNNNNTFWETNWSSGSDSERYITFDLGNTYYLSKIDYLPRSDQNNGTPKILDIYTSLDGTNWTLAKTEDWSQLSGNANIIAKKTIVFENNIRARYVKFHAVDVHWDNANYTYSLAEVDFFAETSETINNMITMQPESGKFIADNGTMTNYTLSIDVSEGSQIQWYSNTENSYLGATEITSSSNSFTPENTDKYYFAKVTNGSDCVYSDIAFVEGIEARISRSDGNYYYGTLSEVIGAANTGETVEILKDIYLETFSRITLNKNIEITSSGENHYKIQRTANTKSTVLFNIENGGELTIDNITIDGGAVWNGDNNDVLLRGTNNSGISGSEKFFSVSTGGKLNITNGTIIQNNSAGNNVNGSIIAVNGKNTEVVISDSVIRNNSANGFGTVLYARTSSDSAAENEIASVTINNSDIYGNITSSGTGGTILLEQKANLNISGGSIHNNNGNTNGGAIYMFGASNVTINNNADISNNKAANGGAIMIRDDNVNNNNVLNLGDCTITGNTATSNGNAIYYSQGTLNITGNVVFSNEQVIYRINSKNVNINTDFSDYSGKIYVKPGSISAGSQIGTLGSNGEAETAVKVLTVKKDDNTDYTTYFKNNAIKYGDKATYTTDLDSEKSVMLDSTTATASTTLTVEATGSDVTYKWYKCDTENDQYELIPEGNSNTLTLTNLTTGSTYYYCVIDNGEVSSNEPVQSTVCEVKVSDFYPCSQAIDKFKSI